MFKTEFLILIGILMVVFYVVFVQEQKNVEGFRGCFPPCGFLTYCDWKTGKCKLR